MKNGSLYIKVNKNSQVHRKVVHIRDVAKLYCYDTKIMEDIYEQIIFQIKSDKRKNYVFSILKLIEQISRLYPSLEIYNIGDIDFLIEYIPPKKVNKVWEVIKVFFVSCIVFFGSAFTIMTFNEDSSIKDIFAMIHKSVMGTEAKAGSILEISYAVGLPIGIIIFFNHFSKLKVNNDPTPMQVQMRLYEENMEKTLIENAGREGKSIDVN